MPQRPSTLSSKPASRSVLEGGCLCGAVRYKVTGPALDRGSCHCRSSAEVTRSFCGHCGSPLTYRHAGRPDRLDIMTCSLDDPDALPPAYHVWISHKPRWAVIDDRLPAFETTRPKR